MCVLSIQIGAGVYLKLSIILHYILVLQCTNFSFCWFCRIWILPIKSYIVENVDVRLLKRSKCSELMDSKLDKDVNAPYPPSPSIQV